MVETYSLQSLVKSTLEPPSHRLYSLPAGYYSKRYGTVNWMVGCLRFCFWQWGCRFFATSPFAPSCTWRFPSAWAGACGWALDADQGGCSIELIYWCGEKRVHFVCA